MPERERASSDRLFCPTCGRPLVEQGRELLRREADFRGVKLALSERHFLAAVIALVNGCAAIVTFVLTRYA